MQDAVIVHEEEVMAHGKPRLIRVFCRGERRYFAATEVEPGDVIINDGFSVEEVLERQTAILAAAFQSREMNRILIRLQS